MTDEELREQVRAILQGPTKALWRNPDHDEFPQDNYEDDFVQLIKARDAAIRIDELENMQRYRDYTARKYITDTMIETRKDQLRRESDQAKEGK